MPPSSADPGALIAIAPELVDRLERHELDRIVIHEWAHVQRRDDLAHAVALVVRLSQAGTRRSGGSIARSRSSARPRATAGRRGHRLGRRVTPPVCATGRPIPAGALAPAAGALHVPDAPARPHPQAAVTDVAAAPRRTHVRATIAAGLFVMGAALGVSQFRLIGGGVTGGEAGPRRRRMPRRQRCQQTRSCHSRS